MAKPVLYRLTEVSLDGDCEYLIGWFKSERKANAAASELSKFEVTPFTLDEVAAILMRLKVYD